jgi:preprotein translocase subunit SecG
MVILLTILHVFVCLFLVVVVLLQSGKAADLAGAFGGMGSQTAFGPRGTATLLSKWTTIAAAMFMVTSLSLAIMQTRTGGSASSVVDRVKPAAVKPPSPVPAPPTGGALPTVTPGPAGSGGSGVKVQMPQISPQQQAPPPTTPAPAPKKK